MSSPGRGAASFLCHFSLINQRCREVDTALCVSLSPAQQRPRLCPQAGALGERREGNHPSSRLHMSAVSPSPFRCLALSPPVFRISTEAAAQMNKNHCPCHLPGCRPPLLRENKTYTGQLVTFVVRREEGREREDESPVSLYVHDHVKLKQI